MPPPSASNHEPVVPNALATTATKELSGCQDGDEFYDCRESLVSAKKVVPKETAPLSNSQRFLHMIGELASVAGDADDQSYMDYTVTDDVGLPAQQPQEHKHEWAQQLPKQRFEADKPVEKETYPPRTTNLLGSRMFSNIFQATPPAQAPNPTITVNHDADDDMTQITCDQTNDDDYDEYPIPRTPLNKPFALESPKTEKTVRTVSDDDHSASTNGGASRVSESSRQRVAEILRQDVWSQDTTIVQAALEHLAREAAVGPQNRSSITRFGGLLAILRAMEVNLNHDRIQMAACTALEKLALDADTQVAIGEVGGISAVVGAMRTHVDNDGVQQAGCAALVNISHHHGTENDDHLEISADGAIQALCTSMMRHADNVEIQANAFGALANLCLDNQERLKELSQAGGLAAMTMALQKPWKSKTEKHEAISTLSILLRSLAEYDQ
jgi:hypothetical protein